jgi:hypothetical protein
MFRKDYLRKIGAGYFNPAITTTSEHSGVMGQSVVAGATNSSVSMELTSSGTNVIKVTTDRDYSQDVKYYYPTGTIQTDVPFIEDTSTFVPKNLLRKYGRNLERFVTEQNFGVQYPDGTAQLSGYQNNILTIVSNATGVTINPNEAGLGIAIVKPSSSGTADIVLF